uniref:Neurofilament medium polypeptide-like n=1 Tax=Saccoglossus kowalevskii TaxID=10224 RepID=A0ABM0MZL2_SACKO|nr:PREDICTED: neurofilament medium polypeptide-like [Saccoglossus kowalevskii]
MSAMKRNTIKQKYLERSDVATTILQRSRTSMSSNGSFIPEIQDFESQFQFELGKSFFDKAVVTAKRNYTINNACKSDDVQLSSMSELSTDGQSWGYHDLSTDNTGSSKSLDGELLQQWDDDNTTNFAEYIINGILDPRIVARKKKLKRKQLEEKAKKSVIPRDQTDDDMQEESISELHTSIEKIELNGENIEFVTEQPREFTENEKAAGTWDSNKCANGDTVSEAKNGDTIGLETDGQQTPNNRESNLTEEQIKEPINNDSSENQSSETIVDIKTSVVQNSSSEPLLMANQQSEGIVVGDKATCDAPIGDAGGTVKEDDTKSGVDGSETTSVGKRSIKSGRSSGKGKKVTFEEKKKGKPKSAKSAKGKKGNDKKGGKKDKKGKKKKSPTPPPVVVPDTIIEPEPLAQPSEELFNKPDVEPSEPQEPQTIILDEPPKYCLYTEYKSKEQMVREWLYASNTNGAIRTLPIL